MTESQLTTLIQKYLSGEATEEEKEQVERWYASFDNSEASFTGDDSMQRSWQKIRRRILDTVVDDKAIQAKKRINFWYRYRWAAAAAVIFLISGAFFFLNRLADLSPQSIAVLQIKQDIQPGGNKAVLTLGNGQKIILDSANKGLVSRQGNTKVIKLNSGQLSYSKQLASTGVGDSRQLRKQKVLYNTITTPRGGQYKVVLPDGSKVWLNASSSLRFPTAFTGTTRKIQMTGEAYFEIAQKAHQPFVVTSGEMEVKVLGTHFDVMAYENEQSIKTTLLEGVVKVTKGDGTLLLQPGQQAVLKPNGRLQLNANINLNKIVAWKNGLFWFDNDNIQEVMKQLARWYNVDVKLKGEIPDLFTGSIPRNLSLSRVFEVLQKTGRIQYQIIDNKTVVVSSIKK